MSVAITFEGLRRRFGEPRTISIYGRVIVVPKSEWKLGWNERLGSEGCRITPLDVDEKPSYLVSVPKKAEEKREKASARGPDKKARKTVWTKNPSMESKLIELANQRPLLTVRQIHERLKELFPRAKFTAGGVGSHIWKLEGRGLVGSRKELQNKWGARAEGKEAAAPFKPGRLPVTPQNPIDEIVRRLERTVDALTFQAAMGALEGLEAQGALKIPSKVRELHCRALTTKSAEEFQALFNQFIERVHHLMEACQ